MSRCQEARTATFLNRLFLADDPLLGANNNSYSVLFLLLVLSASLADISRLRDPTRPRDGPSIGRWMENLVARGGGGGDTTSALPNPGSREGEVYERAKGLDSLVNRQCR